MKIFIQKDHFFSRITISDNGVGIPQEKISSSGLGLMIVEKIIKEQLKGNLQITSEVGKGTTVKFEIKNEY